MTPTITPSPTTTTTAITRTTTTTIKLRSMRRRSGCPPLVVFKSLISLLAATVVVVVVVARVVAGDYNYCHKFWAKPDTGTLEDCALRDLKSYPILPIFSSIYCFNNGSGICKGLAGKYEILFNTFTDTIIGPMTEPGGATNGWHERQPVTYNTKGYIIYADRAIQWAKAFVRDELGVRYNLLSAESFNWCLFTASDDWPYKSSILDPHSDGQYHIYFFNRQSCIYNSQTKKVTHYNTRFIHNTHIKIDHDMNPLIFVMEDNMVAEGTDRFRLVKNKRQHWFESSYRVIDHPKLPGFNFVKIKNEQETPCKIDGTRSILSSKAFREYTKLNWCMTDKHVIRQNSKYNSIPVNKWCGFDEIEMADLPYAQHYMSTKGRVYECELHNLADGVPEAESFLGVTYSSVEDWDTVEGGFAFTAFTTVPKSHLQVQVLMIYAFYKARIEDEYDENYPVPYVANYMANFNLNKKTWKYDRFKNSRMVKNLNYVDDIAWLAACNTILIIFGPLYTEQKIDLFGSNETTKLGSIDRLGMWEMTNAFFGVHNMQRLYAYHRTNFVAQYSYVCGSNDGMQTLVTGQREETYKYRHGYRMFPMFEKHLDYADNPQLGQQYSFSEEKIFHDLNITDVDRDEMIEPPDPFKYPYNPGALMSPGAGASNLWLYIMIALGCLTILTMCIICLVTLRRRHRRRQKELAMSTIDPLYTARSGGLSSAQSGASAMPTNRSSMSSRPTSLAGASTATQRSGTLSRGSSRHSSTASHRSGAPDSSQASGSHRSGLIGHGPSRSQRSGAPVPISGAESAKSRSRSQSSSRRRAK